jgi:ribosomal protein S12 methylthiotransferase
MSVVQFRAASGRAASAGGLAGVRIYLDSLGCAKNLVDSEATLGLLHGHGAVRVAAPDTADVLVVNTCGFLDQAREESIERILELAQLKTTGAPQLLAVLGCLVARAAEELRESIPEVDVWLPAGSHGALAESLQRLLAQKPAPAQRAATDRSGSGRAPAGAFAGFGRRVLLTPPHTAYLKISEGCSNACTFCSIPLMRGTQRSRPLQDIVAEARRLAAAGVRELHVVAQDSTHWGFDLPRRRDLLDLCTELAAVDGIEWIRLLYAHPAHLTPRMIDGLFALPQMARYLDMPIQHAVPRLLRAMRRGHGPERIRDLVARLRATAPDITLRTTVIVGFPGETDRDFAALCRFVESVGWDRLGVFTYSREPGTAAYDLPARARASTATARLQILTDLQMQIAAERNAARVGRRMRVLVDGSVDAEERAESPLARAAAARGRSQGEALDIDGAVYLAPVPGVELAAGTFVEAEVVGADAFDLLARPAVPAPRA